MVDTSLRVVVCCRFPVGIPIIRWRQWYWPDNAASPARQWWRAACLHCRCCAAAEHSSQHSSVYYCWSLETELCWVES